MRPLTCSATRRRLHAYHDEELSIDDQIAVSSHLEWCDDCAGAFADLRSLGVALRAAMPGREGLSNEEETSFQATVLSRIDAEHTASFTAQVREMFEDMHLVYAGLGATAAACVCLLIMLAMMRFATTARPDSLAAMMQVLSSPGSNLNPVSPLQPGIQMPRALDETFSRANTTNAVTVGGDSIIMLAAVVTREGTIDNLALLEPGGGRVGHVTQSKSVEDFMGAVSKARFVPAKVDGNPVAVNMVWLMAHTTVRATPVAKKQRIAALTTRTHVNA
jgi:anti-sigma factor RsiW